MLKRCIGYIYRLCDVQGSGEIDTTTATPFFNDTTITTDGGYNFSDYVYGNSSTSASMLTTSSSSPPSSPLRTVSYNELPQMSTDWVWVWLVNFLSGYVGYFFMRSAAKILLQVQSPSAVASYTS